MVWANKYFFPGLIVFFACLVVACASKEPPETAGNLSQGQATAVERYCLRALWVKTPELMEQLNARLKQGESFVSLARAAAREHPRQVMDRTSCLEAQAMEPTLLEAVKGLEPGQTAGPINLKQGLVLVRVTTDEHFQKGQKLLNSGRHQEAEEALKKDLEINSDHVVSWHLMGISRMGRGDRAGAIEAFDKGLGFAPGSPALLNDKASALMDLKRRDEAIDCYRQAVKTTPNNPLLLNNLAWALAKDGKELPQAEALARKAVQIAPNQPAFWDTLGHVQKIQGKHAQAVVSLHRALILGNKTESTQQQLLSSLKLLEPGVVSRLAGKGGAPPASASIGESNPAASKSGPSSEIASPSEKKPDEKKAAPPVASKEASPSLAAFPQAPPVSPKKPATSRDVASKEPLALEQKPAPAPPNFSKIKSPVLSLEGQPVVNLPPLDESILRQLAETEPLERPADETEQAGPPELVRNADEKPSTLLAPGREIEQPAQKAKAQAPAEPVSPEIETRAQAPAPPVASVPEPKAQAPSPPASPVEEAQPPATQSGPKAPTPAPSVPAERFLPVLAMAGQAAQPPPLVGEARDTQEPAAQPQILASPEPAEPARRRPPEEAPARADVASSEIPEQKTTTEAAGQTTPAIRPRIQEREPEKNSPSLASVSPRPGEGQAPLRVKTRKSKKAKRFSWAGYYLQTASFRHFDLAQLEMKRFVNSGYSCRLEHMDLGARGKWYRVMVGPYKSKASVVKLGRLLKKEGVVKEYLVVRKEKLREPR